jgi:hypothetical protein
MQSEYRQRYGEYHSDINREEYLYRSGRKEKLETAQITGEYSDLFRLSAIKELEELLKGVAEYRETERASIKRLISFAVTGNIAARIREVTEEIERIEAASQIDWDGELIGFTQSAEVLANEPDVVRRRDLAARRNDVIKRAQDVRAERFAIMQAAAVDLSFQNYAVMESQLNGIDYQRLGEASKIVLSKTESDYATALSRLFARRVGISIDEASPADLGYLHRFDDFDHYFPPARMFSSYSALFADFGFKTEKQENIEIDSEMRHGKEYSSFCSPIRVPEEIKLVTRVAGGQLNYREFLRAAGRAQNYAWTSARLYPEFRIAKDRAVKASWGMLLENLFYDRNWLTGTFGFKDSQWFRHVLGVLHLMAVRTAAARLDYELVFHSGSGNTAAFHAELMTDAVRVNFDETGHLRDVSDHFHPADYLRACALESQLREHLKSQFGLRWWASRKAGEMLIDLWNTGDRYTAEELASLIGLGRLDFEWLATELLDQLKTNIEE